MNKRSVPRDCGKGIRTRRKNFEKDLSTQQYIQKTNPRVPASHEDQGRTINLEKKACQGKEAVNCLIRSRLDLTFPRSARVRSRTDYLKVQRSGRKVGGRYFIILSMDNDLPASRFGITVSRKTGNAVTRNRVKRRIRELQRLNRGSVIPGKDIVVIATRQAPGATFDMMKIEYADLLIRAGLARRSQDT